ncbi:MAG: tetratricopeptide repeat protein [Bryobacteraceae bacterium]
MRKLLDRLRNELNNFVEQRNDLMLVAKCSDDDVAVGLKLLRDLEQSNKTDVFLLFSDNFVQPVPFVSVAIERLREDHRLACSALAEENKPSLPPFPLALLDDSRPPGQRLIHAMTFAHSLLPPQGGHRLVWAMFPLRIADRDAYWSLISELMPWDGIRPWMRGLRLVFRDVAAHARSAPAGVRFRSYDLGQQAIESSFEDEAKDDQLPEERRMQSLLLSAGMDLAYNRSKDATAKYELLLGYYQRTENDAMQAFVLNAFGEMAHRAGDLDKAVFWFECAVDPAAAVNGPVLLATIGRNLGDAMYKLGRYPEAEQYHDNVDKLASHMLDPELKIRALEARGRSQDKQGAFDRAVASFEAAVLLSRNIGLPGFLKQNLEHLKRLYTQLGREDRLRPIQEELAATAEATT